MTDLVYPWYYRIVRREAGNWHFQKSALFCRLGRESVDLDHIEERCGTTMRQVTVELFRINGGRAGWYLANLRDRKYYYCGESKEDVRTQLHALGIGRPDPIEG